MEIIPKKGVGSIHFGMTAADVKAIMGDELVWEEWMGAGLEGELYYTGIVICLDPIHIGEVYEIWIGASLNATYKGLSIFDLDVEAIKQLLETEGVAYNLRDSGDIVAIGVKAYHLAFSFENNRLIQLDLAAPI